MSFFDHNSKGQLLLSDEYLNVKVSMLENGFSYPATINFKKNECTLRSYACGGLSFDFKDHRDYVVCIARNHKTIVLFNVNLKNYSASFLQGCNEQQVDRTFQELEATFDFAYIGRGQINNNIEDLLVADFELSFPKLKDLIGDTTIQRDILYDSKIDSRSVNLSEFSQHLNDFGTISISYDYTNTNDNIETNKTLHPKLSIVFDEGRPIDTIKKEVLKLYEIIAFFMGGDFEIDHIKINTKEKLYSFQNDYIYFSFAKNKKYDSSPILPFGINQTEWSQFHELPIVLFDKYYQLSEDDQSIFVKYSRYKRLNTNEERFLGFFRLLEKLTFFKKYYVSEESLNQVLCISDKYLKKRLSGRSRDIVSFIKRVRRLNGSKNMTESCLRVFYQSIPDDVKKGLNIDKPDFTDICKLRNDITHANSYIIDDIKLFSYERFIHSLLFLSLLKKLDIPFEVCLPVMHKLKYFK